MLDVMNSPENEHTTDQFDPGTTTPGAGTTDPGNGAPATAYGADAAANSNLHTQSGTTVIEDAVVSKIAGIAAREVSGVASLGAGSARVLSNLRESFGANTDVRQGVSVAIHNGVATVGVAIIAEYGVAIHELAEAIRRNIITGVERMTGLVVERVDVTVHDVKLPNEVSEDSDAAGTPAAPAAPPVSSAAAPATPQTGAPQSNLPQS